MDFKEIKKIVELMGEFGLSQFTLEEGDTKLDLRKGGSIDIEAVQRILASSQASYASMPAQQMATPQIATPVDSGQGEGGLPAGVVEIVSPMVGTFYSSPSPDADAFVSVGTKIQPDSVVCIVEAMKVMNQINADVAGEITEILVDNGTAVQYGEPLFRVKTA